MSVSGMAQAHLVWREDSIVAVIRDYLVAYLSVNPSLTVPSSFANSEVIAEYLPPMR